MVLVAGDVYDRAMPAPDTVALLSRRGRCGCIDAGAQVVLSSGNHDSAHPAGLRPGLLERAGLHMRTSLADVGRPVLVGDVAVYPLPYLEPALAADRLGGDERSHAGVLRAAMAAVRADLGAASAPAVRGHGSCLRHRRRDAATPSATSASAGWRRCRPTVFDGVDYVALGHLHGRQQDARRLRYSGSPMAMSFTRASHHKGSWLVDLVR